MLYVGNLADAVLRCLDAPQARGQTYLLSDGADISTPELLSRIASHLGCKARLWPLPVALLRGLGSLLGQGAAVARLTGSLLVDSGKMRRELGWTPPFTLDDGLRETARWYLAERKK
jgi:nucleoside-diphosphate-sugar epimerase